MCVHTLYVVMVDMLYIYPMTYSKLNDRDHPCAPVARCFTYAATRNSGFAHEKGTSQP